MVLLLIIDLMLDCTEVLFVVLVLPNKIFSSLVNLTPSYNTTLQTSEFAVEDIDLILCAVGILYNQLLNSGLSFNSKPKEDRFIISPTLRLDVAE